MPAESLIDASVASKVSSAAVAMCLTRPEQEPILAWPDLGLGGLINSKGDGSRVVFPAEPTCRTTTSRCA